MQLTFYGAVDTVTGSCFLLDTGKKRLLVDCGLFQGRKDIRQRNYGPFPFAPESIDLVLLTHAHIDHCGLIPKLVKHGFRGRILATDCTVEMCRVLLPDSASIQESEVERKNRKAKRAGSPEIAPIYTVDDAYKSLKYFDPVSYNQDILLGDGLRCRFQDAGHILCSALIEVWVRDNEHHTETKIVFSGDLGNKGKPFVRDPSTVWEADYLVLESTYGDRLHGANPEKALETLKEVIWATYKKGGNLLIPAFAVERTQELLYYIFTFDRNGELPPMNIWLDSPLASAITEIFGRNQHHFDEETSDLVANGLDPLGAPHLRFARSVSDSRALNESRGGNIIIAGSGMCDAGRIRHHLKHNLWRSESTVLLAGYQAVGTLGRLLQDGVRKVRLFGEEILVRADIVSIEGFSAHADRNMLREWVDAFQVRPRRVFLVHGEPGAVLALQETLVGDGVDVYRPEWKETVTLEPGLEGTEKLRRVFSSLRNRAEAYLQANPDPGSYQQIFDRLVELDDYLAKAPGSGDDIENL